MDWFVKFINQILQKFKNFGKITSQTFDSTVDSAVNGTADFLNSYNQSGSPTFLGALTNVLNAWSGEHMTNAEVERNQMQMQNQEDIYQRQVIGMQKAGINPALMYGSGAQSAPSAPSAQTPGMNMSDIMNALLLDKQAKLLESQTRNTDADTDKKTQEAEHMKLVNKYYPEVTQTQISSVLSQIGVNDETIKKMIAEVDSIKLDQDLKEIQKIIQKAQADESSAYFKAVRELEEAKTESEKASKREKVASAIMKELEGQFMDKYGAKMGSSEWIALASAITSVLGVDLSLFGDSPFVGLYKMIKDRAMKRDEGRGGRTSSGSNNNDIPGAGGR